MTDCTPTQLHHLVMYAIVVTFLFLATLVALAALWRYVRAGYALYRESGFDRATVWAEIDGIRRANLAADRMMRRAMACMRGGK